MKLSDLLQNKQVTPIVTEQQDPVVDQMLVESILNVGEEDFGPGMTPEEFVKKYGLDQE